MGNTHAHAHTHPRTHIRTHTHTHSEGKLRTPVPLVCACVCLWYAYKDRDRTYFTLQVGLSTGSAAHLGCSQHVVKQGHTWTHWRRQGWIAVQAQISRGAPSSFPTSNTFWCPHHPQSGGAPHLSSLLQQPLSAPRGARSFSAEARQAPVTGSSVESSQPPGRAVILPKAGMLFGDLSTGHGALWVPDTLS